MGIIYKITNTVTKQSYIGQTTQILQRRWKQHLWDSYHKNSQAYNYPLQKHIREFGEENFTIEELRICSSQQELDEYEIKYIEKYNAMQQGYNTSRGGKKSSLTQEETMEIIKWLQNHSSTIGAKKQLEKKLKIKLEHKVIEQINKGERIFCPKDISYPITQNNANNKFKETARLIKETNLSFKEIADKTNTNFHYVEDVNRGKIRKGCTTEKYSFPIRKYEFEKANMTKELALKIVSMLKEDKYSADQIGELLGIPGYTVGQINRGKMVICRELSENYPIRKKLHRNKDNCTKAKKEVLEIAKLLMETTLSLEEIAGRYNVTKSTINRINNKQIWKNLLEDFSPPLRTNPNNFV